MLRLAIGYSKQLVEAKQRAIFFYEQVEERKMVRFVETQPGKNELDEDVWVTTIWFDVIEPTPEEKKKEEEKFHYIGSTDIDPTDPDWKDKMEALRLEKEDILATALTDWLTSTEEYPQEAT